MIFHPPKMRHTAICIERRAKSPTVKDCIFCRIVIGMHLSSPVYFSCKLWSRILGIT